MIEKDIGVTLSEDNELSNGSSWRESHEKDETEIRPEIQDISSNKLESEKSLAQIACENSVCPRPPFRWRDELAENPERAFSGNRNRCKYEAKIAELERLLSMLIIDFLNRFI